MKPKLYLEGPIPSYYVARPSRDIVVAAQQQQTRDWWDYRHGLFDIYVSEIVLEEIDEGEKAMARQRLDLVKPFPMLSITNDVVNLARALVDEGPLPKKAARDAAHIALAAVHKIDFLLTWNCRHIANPTMLRRIAFVCDRREVTAPVICTPHELLTDLIYEDEN